MGLKRKQPPNIHLLSLELYDENHVLVRLEHFFEINEDQQYSRSKKINLEDLLVGYEILDYKEMALNAIADKYAAESTRMKFDTTFNPYSNFANIFISPEGKTQILIDFEIRFPYAV